MKPNKSLWYLKETNKSFKQLQWPLTPNHMRLMWGIPSSSNHLFSMILQKRSSNQNLQLLSFNFPTPNKWLVIRKSITVYTLTRAEIKQRKQPILWKVVNSQVLSFRYMLSWHSLRIQTNFTKQIHLMFLCNIIRHRSPSKR